MKKAVEWALSQLDGKSPYEHGFIDLVRQYMIDNSIEHRAMSFADVEPYIK